MPTGRTPTTTIPIIQLSQFRDENTRFEINESTMQIQTTEEKSNRIIEGAALN